MIDQTPPSDAIRGPSSDVQALLDTATAQSSATRAERREASRARADETWLTRKRRHARFNLWADRSLVGLLATCWIGAALVCCFL